MTRHLKNFHKVHHCTRCLKQVPLVNECNIQERALILGSKLWFQDFQISLGASIVLNDIRHHMSCASLILDSETPTFTIRIYFEYVLLYTETFCSQQYKDLLWGRVMAYLGRA